jgi:hypothetical protein
MLDGSGTLGGAAGEEKLTSIGVTAAKVLSSVPLSEKSNRRFPVVVT